MRRRTDIQIHAAVTIMNRVNNIELIGQKETELPQFCVQIDARDTPVRKMDVEAAFKALGQKCLDQMRQNGLLKAGS